MIRPSQEIMVTAKQRSNLRLQRTSRWHLRVLGEPEPIFRHSRAEPSAELSSEEWTTWQLA